MSYHHAVQQLFELQANEDKWTSGPIMIPVAKSVQDECTEIIDITLTIGYKKRMKLKACGVAEDRYWLHPSLNTNSADFRQNKIHPIFALACHSAGFNIHAEYCSRKNNKFPNILFSCVKGKDRNEVKEAEYTSKRPRNVKKPHQAAIPRSTRTLVPRHSKVSISFSSLLG